MNMTNLKPSRAIYVFVLLFQYRFKKLESEVALLPIPIPRTFLET